MSSYSPSDVWSWPECPHTHHLMYEVGRNVLILTIWCMKLAGMSSYSPSDVWSWPERPHTHHLMYEVGQNVLILTIWFMKLAGMSSYSPSDVWSWPERLHTHHLMYEVGWNVLLVPFGNLLDDDLCLVNPTCGEQPTRGLRHYPPTPQIRITNRRQSKISKLPSKGLGSFLRQWLRSSPFHQIYAQWMTSP